MEGEGKSGAERDEERGEEVRDGMEEEVEYDQGDEEEAATAEKAEG
jgi:hypothetical protein